MKQKVIAIAGYKNTGKTTLIVSLVRELVGRGFKISTLKHAHHNFDIDHPGRDSYRHRQAGAHEVAIVGGHRWAVLHEQRTHEEPGMDDMLAKLEPCDLVIIEGYRRSPIPKIEAVNIELDHPRLTGEGTDIVAVVTNGPLDGELVPTFDRNDIPAIADLVAAVTGLEK